MALMFFFINFNYTILRDTKDSLIVNAPGSGAEAIPFLKLWGVVPFAILFMLVYSKLSNIFNKPKLFYTMILSFVAFFGFFALVLYPNRDVLHPTAFCDNLQAYLPEGFSGLVAIIRNWTFSLFYIMAELWGSVALSLLFWGFANDTTRPSETKRFYGVFGLGANFAMIFSGPLIIYFSNIRDKLPPGADAWGASLNYLIGTVILSAFVIMGIYWWINKNVLTDTRFYDPKEQQKVKKEKPKMSLTESFKFLAKSRYILLLALLVISYGIAINLVEVTWKNQLKLQFAGNSNDYSAFMGEFSFLTGAATIFMMLFVSGNVIRKFGWTPAALLTPIMILVTGVGFFTFIIFKDSLAALVAMMGTTPLMMAVVVGQAQNILSKSTKYSLFDPTKEMVYVPLDQESKVKGKAAIDVVGARLGKAGGALVNQTLILFFGSISAITPYVAGVLFLIIFVWMWAAKKLGKEYNQLISEKEEQAKAEAAATAATAPAEPAFEKATVQQ